MPRPRTLVTLVLVTVCLVAAFDGVAMAKKKDKVLEVAQAQAEFEAAARGFVGTVEGTDAYISVTVLPNGDVEVYICDGADVVAWPTGKVKKNDEFTARAASGLRVEGTITDDGVTGTVTLEDGSEHAFSADPATAPAGLYERQPAGDADPARIATIVLADGTQRGAAQPPNAVKCNHILSSFRDYYKDIQQDAAAYAGAMRQWNNYNNSGCPAILGPATV